MEAVQREMNLLWKRFENQEKELGRFLSLVPVDLEAVEALCAVFEDLQVQVRACTERLLEQMRNENKSEEEIGKEYTRIDGYFYRFELMKKKVKTLLKNDEDKTNSIRSGPVSGETRRGFKLPNVEIKKFDGTRTDWIGFWAQFVRVHEDPELQNTDKFWYLLNSLKPGSEAHDLASLYPQSSENYPKVVEALRKKYGDDDMLLQIYIRELLSLVISNVSSKDKLPFQSLYMKVESHLRALQTLKLQKADPKIWLYPLVESSLPERVLYNWQRSPLSTVDGSLSDPPQSRLDLLLQFMGKELEIQQKIEFARKFSQDTTKVSAPKSSTKKDSSEKEVFRKPIATVSSFHAHDRPVCAFCEKSNHKSAKCYQAAKMTIEEVKNCLRKEGLCFKCFEPNHAASECKTKVKCDHCGFRHQSLVCYKNEGNQKDLKRVRQESSSDESSKKNKRSLIPLRVKLLFL